MNKKALRADILLLITAAIWGSGFVAQRAGMENLRPFTYSGVRFILGSLSLLPLIFFLDHKKRMKTAAAANAATAAESKTSAKTLIGASCAVGFFLFCGANIQQIGLLYTTVGNSGFITGLYVVLVPVVGFIMGKKTGLPTWLGVMLTFAGLFFVSGAGNIASLNRGDLLTAASALFWAGHVLMIDKMVAKVDPLKLSCGQFAVTGLASLVAALFTELSAGFNLFIALKAAAIPVLYGGLVPVGLAYTLQVVAQKDAPPAHAVIILCLETVFAAICGVLFFAERFHSQTILGFVLMFSGMIATQLDVIRSQNKTGNSAPGD
jgi:drug/metabolite transporter (DMT)-like permease